MPGVQTRIGRALELVDDGAFEIEAALADGLQCEDLPAIEVGLEEIREGLIEIKEVGLDIVFARRTLNVGRHRVIDERFQAREASQARLRSEERQRKSPNGCGPVGEKRIKRCA